MTDTAPPPPPRPRRRLRWLLIASLALNFLFVGLLAGGALKMWRAAPGSPPPELALLWRALPDEARHALRGRDDDESARRESRAVRMQRMQGELASLRALLVAEPFDRAAMEARLGQARGRQAEHADRMLNLMLDRIEALPPAERARMAERLERRWDRRPGRD